MTRPVAVSVNDMGERQSRWDGLGALGRLWVMRAPPDKGRGALQLGLLQRLSNHSVAQAGTWFGEESEAQEDQAEEEQAHA